MKGSEIALLGSVLWEGFVAQDRESDSVHHPLSRAYETAIGVQVAPSGLHQDIDQVIHSVFSSGPFIHKDTAAASL